MNDAEYMRLALALAERGRGWTAPNPMVGAVIVKDGAVIGQGWHERYGDPTRSGMRWRPAPPTPPEAPCM